MVLAGGRATLKDGLGIANERLGKIMSWALLATTLGVVPRTGREEGWLGKIIIAILGAAWSILTYFIVSVIVFEDQNVFDGVKRSAFLVKKTWGENVGKGITFSALILMAMVPLVLLGFLAFAIHPLVGILLWVVGFTLLLTVVSAMDGIFKVTLYRYAWQGAMAEGFSPELIQSAFVPKKKTRFGF